MSTSWLYKVFSCNKGNNKKHNNKEQSKKEGKQASCSVGQVVVDRKLGHFFAYWGIPPSIDDLWVNHCALRADCVCSDRAKGRKVVYKKSWGRYQSLFSIKTIISRFFRQHAKLRRKHTHTHTRWKKVFMYALMGQLCMQLLFFAMHRNKCLM